VQAGIDEAGRGCLAGPVVAAAVILQRPIACLNDSKALTEAKRALLFKEITDHAIWSYATASAEEVDQINIRQATLRAMQRALEGLQVTPELVSIDGRDQIKTRIAQKAVIGGDRIVPEIMAASIVAKHIRDQMMYLLHQQYPEYAFSSHKGYGTKVHMDSMKKYGLIAGIHRITFKPCQEYA
jgi:ribonuclease HII